MTAQTSRRTPTDSDLQAHDPREPIDVLLRDLRTATHGLASLEAARRLTAHGPNELTRHQGRHWVSELSSQFTHPLALLLWIAAILSWITATPALSIAIVAVIAVNAAFAFVQEQQAERAVEALAAYLPAQAATIRDGHRQSVDARDLVPGDLLIVVEGDRVSADARILSGGVEVDLSTLNGESMPAYRSAEPAGAAGSPGPLLEARDLLFSGTSCTAGQAIALVFATGMRSCHTAGIRLLVITGDDGLTAATIARSVGIGGPDTKVVTGAELERMSDHALDELLAEGQEMIFARSSPEAKLRIADALRARGEVVAMTGDGVNDAPALRRADIGIAMGRSGTDVAREAATLVLTDDNFATIVVAIQTGRQVYDNVRKFIVYIFAHATPEVVPFLVFALSGGQVPLPLTVLLILAIDLGTETLPALALGREPAEPGLMDRPPRPRNQGVIHGRMLLRAWLLLGGISAALVMAGYFLTLHFGGWHLGDPTGPGAPLHHLWLQATTMTFLGIVACQIGTALAARTQTASLRSIGLASNRLLLWGMAFELLFAIALITVPSLQHVFGTALPDPMLLLVLLPFPLIVWGADEMYRWQARKRTGQHRSGEQISLTTESEASA
ncbi:cation-transporting P-type ATPase [Streptosporangiaceae bacterium NEAU-GS5]|nr:cation-transporting P-type ATPase [Streptosporangiaceae bacterium NEAU-GS5]